MPHNFGDEISKLNLEPLKPQARDDKDYAIEHAGYLADAVEHYQQALNKLAEAMLIIGSDDEILDQLRSDLSEARSAMNSAVYEFRKRAARCK